MRTPDIRAETAQHPGAPAGDRPRALPYERICVIGAGSWGTALATVARRAGRQVTLWGRDADLIRAIRRNSMNPRYLPGILLPSGLAATTDLAAALFRADAVLLVTPSTSLRAMGQAMRPHMPEGIPIALCAKGIERGTGALLSHVVAEVLPGHPVGALSGPTFAHETALGHPTAATVAFEFSHADRLAPHDSPAVRLALSMGSEDFRPYISDDLVGVEIGGAVKNVIAIACGMMTGAGFAENTRAALIARGLDEMMSLAEALGGRRDTVAGLSGVGDLTLTCSSQTSRNMALGVQLGEGRAREACFDGQPVTVEGEVNAISVVDLARRLQISMPICEAVHDILHEGADLKLTFSALWTRPIQHEQGRLPMTLAHPMAGPGQ
ncbi:MAG: NAD(P)-dependent glycerol-3-phosphate dehydrogenase [Rhodobacteraceae bacterium]|nr:NAD(P)-dependent glycerol-3-phosphate dehydrogenase [Paracoccaceae bacterium]